jgi:hypothetical protein
VNLAKLQEALVCISEALAVDDTDTNPGYSKVTGPGLEYVLHIVSRRTSC